MDEDLAFAGITRQAALLREGHVSARDLVHLHLDRIERLDPTLNAFRVVHAERALAAASAADNRRAAGEDAPLLGVPIALKDELDDVGEVSTHGTAAYSTPASSDAEVVRRLKVAGAIVLGRTTMPEFAIMGSTETRAWGITRNPWAPGRTPGGSSGGSGAAVAAGLVGATSASDGAGSIRIPAANCGLFGLKPQRGRVSPAPASEVWLGLSTQGSVTRTVADTALWLDVTSGNLPGDAHRVRPPPRPFVDALDGDGRRLRVAWSVAPPRLGVPARIDPAVVAATTGTTELLEQLGHSTVQRDPDYGNVGIACAILYMRSWAVGSPPPEHPERLEARTRNFVRLGRALPRRAVDWARGAQQQHTARINAIFEDVDVLLTPTTGEPPVEIGRWEGHGALRTSLGMARTYPFTVVWNYTGQPAAAVPAGFTDDGLPLSVQLIAPPGREDMLLALAAELEAARPWANDRPALASRPDPAG